MKITKLYYKYIKPFVLETFLYRNQGMNFSIIFYNKILLNILSSKHSNIYCFYFSCIKRHQQPQLQLLLQLLQVQVKM